MIGLHLGKVRVSAIVGMVRARVMGWRMYCASESPYKARRATTFVYGDQLWSLSELQF